MQDVNGVAENGEYQAVGFIDDLPQLDVCEGLVFAGQGEAFGPLLQRPNRLDQPFIPALSGLGRPLFCDITGGFKGLVASLNPEDDFIFQCGRSLLATLEFFAR